MPPRFAMSSTRAQLIRAALPELDAQGQAIIERFYAPSSTAVWSMLLCRE
jgi:hemoglobin-like flavoprotein